MWSYWFYPRGPESLTRDHKFHNLGRGFHHGYHNHASSPPLPAVDVEKKIF